MALPCHHSRVDAPSDYSEHGIRVSQTRPVMDRWISAQEAYRKRKDFGALIRNGPGVLSERGRPNRKMDQQKTFDSFLRGWIKDRIEFLGEVVDPSDQAYFARIRARELTDLAKDRGFYTDLLSHLQGQTVLKFVEDQYWLANLRQRDQ